jgi:NAD(P)-dependent dehydrogenase (short-subunit alcohol dehydrogenase family)
MADSLNGKWIVIAGGSGGLGAESVSQLAGEGARLIVSYLSNEERAGRLSGVEQVVQADLANAASRRELLDRAPEMYGLVVFAGDPSRAATSAEVESAMRRSYEVNCLGPLLLARDAVERMKAKHTSGAIVLFGTMQAVRVFPGSTPYGIGKAGLIQGARILAKECRGSSNIRVNVIAPGVIAAGMAQASIAAGKYDRFLEEGTIHRFGSPSDIARAVRFLLEPDNYITGQVLSVDGGITL